MYICIYMYISTYVYIILYCYLGDVLFHAKFCLFHLQFPFIDPKAGD